MNATEALQLTEAKKPLLEEQEYDELIKCVKYGIEKGKTEFSINKLPSDNVYDRLINDGYTFLVFDGGSWFPKFYSISWAKREEKKKWYQRIFN